MLKLVGVAQRGAYRKENATFCYIEQNTSPIIGPALTKDQLQDFSNQLLTLAEQLPDIPGTSEP